MSEDTISRQVAIDAFYKYPNMYWTTLDVLAKIDALPPAQPEHTNSWCINSWCIDCKEYDTENKCCPRYNRVIKQTLDDAYRHGETEAEARYHDEIVRCEDCNHWSRESILDGFCSEDCMRHDEDFYCGYAERKTNE